MKVHEEIGHCSNVPMSWFWGVFLSWQLIVLPIPTGRSRWNRSLWSEEFYCSCASPGTWLYMVKIRQMKSMGISGSRSSVQIRMLYDSLMTHSWLMTMSQYDCTPWVLKVRQLLCIASLFLGWSAKCQPGTGTGWVWWQSCHMGGGRKELRASGSCRSFFKFQKPQEICTKTCVAWGLHYGSDPWLSSVSELVWRCQAADDMVAKRGKKWQSVVINWCPLHQCQWFLGFFWSNGGLLMSWGCFLFFPWFTS